MLGLGQQAGEMVMGLGSVVIAVAFVAVLLWMQRPRRPGTSRSGTSGAERD